jgi:hypothetical protein
MTHEQIHAELVALCDKIVTGYRDDLLVHDKRNIEQHAASVPFLHFSRGTGTYMVHLIAASEYPAKGVLVPFLFGTANREHCLDSVTDMVDHCTDFHNGTHICHYWNGRKLLRITLDKAKQIASEYDYIIRQQWAAGIGPNTPVTSYVALGM